MNNPGWNIDSEIGENVSWMSSEYQGRREWNISPKLVMAIGDSSPPSTNGGYGEYTPISP
jgi:hypothetical protein